MGEQEAATIRAVQGRAAGMYICRSLKTSALL
jgi:hypothetical protein